VHAAAAMVVTVLLPVAILLLPLGVVIVRRVMSPGFEPAPLLPASNARSLLPARTRPAAVVAACQLLRAPPAFLSPRFRSAGWFASR